MTSDQPVLAMVLGYRLPEEQDRPLGMCDATWTIDHDPMHVFGTCNSNGTRLVLGTCRSCGPQYFELCSEDVEDGEDGVAHVAPWCVYCTETVAAHEVIKIEVLE